MEPATINWNAVEEEKNARLPLYQNKNDVELNRVADEESWNPSEHIQALASNAKTVSVELVNQDTDLTILTKEMRETRDIGVVVMGNNIGRHSKPSLIVLTTEKKLYAFDTNVEKCIMFLSVKLMSKAKPEQAAKARQHKYYFTDILNEADCLYHNYSINLGIEENVLKKIQCCSGLHIHLMQNLEYKPDAVLLSLYPPTIRAKVRGYGRKIRVEKFEKLLELWLDVEKSEIDYQAAQLPHLNTRPLSLTAVNIIKKRCLLVRPLAKVLEHYHMLEIITMSNCMYTYLIGCSDKVRRDLIRERLDAKEKGKASIGFLTYLDC